MLKMPLVENIEKMFHDEGYATCRYHGCFDLAAKKRMLLFLKILKNVDSFQFEQARNLKIICTGLDARPLLVGAQTRRERLERGIVYVRFDMPAISEATLEDLVCNGIFPRIYRDKGGVYVEIDSDALKTARNKKELTQEKLAEIVGVNKKTIYEHENRNLRMMLSTAEALESVLNEKITTGIELFSGKHEAHGKPSSGLEKIVFSELQRLGFETEFAKQTPFDVVAKEKTVLISDVENNRRRILYRATALKRFVSFLERPAIIITDKIKIESELPLIERSELKELESGKELIRIARKKN